MLASAIAHARLMSDNGSSALSESVRSVLPPQAFPPFPSSLDMLTSTLQDYLHRPRGAGERASSVPAHRDEQAQATQPAQWDPWAASLPPSRDLSGTRRNGINTVLHCFVIFFVENTYGSRRIHSILYASRQCSRIWE